MKKSATTKIKPAATSLFHVTAQGDDSLAAARKPAASLQKKPLADLMLHPEKVEAVLEITKAASQVAGPSPSPTSRKPRIQRNVWGPSGKTCAPFPGENQI